MTVQGLAPLPGTVTARSAASEGISPVSFVFADVDDTIIRGKSLLGFAQHLAKALPPEQANELEVVLGALLVRLRAGEERSRLNRDYYMSVLGGRTVSDVRAAIAAWYAKACTAPDFFKMSVCEFLARARRAGAQIVLLSGSFRELIEPIATHVGASDIVSAPLERLNGRYTGELSAEPTVESGKAEALMNYAARHGIDLARCAGVGDDISDLAFLRLVKYRMVPADGQADMVRHARAEGWRVLTDDSSSASSPLPWLHPDGA